MFRPGLIAIFLLFVLSADATAKSKVVKVKAAATVIVAPQVGTRDVHIGVMLSVATAKKAKLRSPYVVVRMPSKETVSRRKPKGVVRARDLHTGDRLSFTFSMTAKQRRAGAVGVLRPRGTVVLSGRESELSPAQTEAALFGLYRDLGKLRGDVGGFARAVLGQLAQMNSSIVSLDTRIAGLESRVVALRVDLDELRAELQASEATLGDRIDDLVFEVETQRSELLGAWGG